ncbi:MAG: hypothetical protein MHM6MM_000661 [Cercozoa sp. M6MM]
MQQLTRRRAVKTIGQLRVQFTHRRVIQQYQNVRSAQWFLVSPGADPNQIAQQFVQYYYSTFDSNIQGLAALYRPESFLTYEADQVVGKDAIIAHLTSRPFTKIAHQVTSVRAQPIPQSGGLMILVNGDLKVDDEEYPTKFAQVFHLLPAAGNQFWVQNDIFSLNYG